MHHVGYSSSGSTSSTANISASASAGAGALGDGCAGGGGPHRGQVPVRAVVAVYMCKYVCTNTFACKGGDKYKK